MRRVTNRREAGPPEVGGVMGFAMVAALAVVVRATLEVLPGLSPLAVWATWLPTPAIDHGCGGHHERPEQLVVRIGPEGLTLDVRGEHLREHTSLSWVDGAPDDDVAFDQAAWWLEDLATPRAARGPSILVAHGEADMATVSRARDLAATWHPDVVLAAGVN